MTEEKYHSDHGKHRYEVVDELKNRLTKFLYTELPIKVIMDCRTAATHTFRRRLGFKQYNITLTRKQLMLAKNRKFICRRKHETQYNVFCYRIDLYFHGCRLAIKID